MPITERTLSLAEWQAERPKPTTPRLRGLALDMAIKEYVALHPTATRAAILAALGPQCGCTGYLERAVDRLVESGGIVISF